MDLKIKEKFKNTKNKEEFKKKGKCSPPNQMISLCVLKKK